MPSKENAHDKCPSSPNTIGQATAVMLLDPSACVQFRTSSQALSPFKMEWSLEFRAKDCTRMREKYPDRVPLIVERESDKRVPELAKCKLLMNYTVTVAQALRIIRNKAGLGRDCRLQLYVNGRMLEHEQLIADVHMQERDEDGFLYCTYSMDQACSTRSKSTEASDTKAQAKEDFWSAATTAAAAWAPTSSYSWTPSGGWKVQQRAAAPKEKETGENFEMQQMCSKKEQRARSKFQNRMRKRAAGPRESPETAVVKNTNLAQAIASCKLDTALSGMIQVATKGGAGTSPGTCASTYTCGMPCALRVHTVRQAK